MKRILLTAMAVTALWGSCSNKNKTGTASGTRQEAADGPLRIACLGGSNIRGYQIPDLEHNSWPGQLQALAGEEWLVMNYGTSVATVMKEGDISYWGSPSLKQAVAFNPDIVILDFGWNDIKPVNRVRMESDFVRDYSALIDEFKALPSKPEIYILLPPVYEEPGNGIAEKYAELEGYYRQIIERNGVHPIDLHTPMAGVREYYNRDLVHYSVEGSGRAAEEIFAVLKADRG